MHNIVLFGPPGVGKGTQSQYLIERYALVHIAPGDLLRAQIKQNTPLGQQTAEYINNGKLAPDTLVTDIVFQAIAAHRHSPGFLFDGFPRTMVQAQSLPSKMADLHLDIDAVIFIDAPEEALLQRIKLRAQSAGRTDDQDDEKVATRMRTYLQDTLPVAQYYAQQGKLHKVDGMGTVEEVFSRIVAVLSPLSQA